MRRWTYILGGLLAWATHFSGLYAAASLAAQTAAHDGGEWRLAAAGLSAACAAACVALAVLARRRLTPLGDAGVALMDQLALLGALVGLIAIAWQTLVILIG